MPKVGFVEKTIFNIEGIDVDFLKDGKNVRSEVMLPTNYKAGKQTKNAANVSFLKEKLKKQFPGYDFIVRKADGDSARGNILLGNLRDTYLDDED